MADITLADLDSGKFSLSKAAVFYANAWDFDSELALTFLGFTEGEVSMSPNESFQELALEEYSGEAPHEAYVQGEAPEITVPLFTADPGLRSILSPTGGKSGGFRRQLPVKEYTLVCIPEELFLSSDGQTELALAYVTGTGWQIGGQALSSEQEDLIDQSLWLWRGFFSKPPITYRHENAGKSVDECTFRVMYQVAAPNGHRLYTIGDPSDAGIDVNSGVTGSS